MAQTDGAGGVVGVVFGGPSPEHDISILTGLQAARALASDGVDVCCLYWKKNAEWLRVPVDAEAKDFLEPEPKGAVHVELRVPGGFVEPRRMRASAIELDSVLNCCHGGPGEDGTLTGLLALAGLAVSGPRPQASALMMDKLAAAGTAAAAGVPTIATSLVPLKGDGAAVLASLPPTPWVVKPRFGGSSLGVEAGVDDLDTARALARRGVGRAGMLIQPLLEGWRDVNIAVRTYPELQLSEIERPLRDESTIYGYHDKYLAGGGGAGMDSAPRELPANLPAKVREQILDYARTLVSAFGITGAPRIDFLWDGDDQVVLCEVNAIPGAWGAYLWQAIDIAPARLYRSLVDEARRAPVLEPQWAATSDGKALRAAGSIAAKLT
jgi:D-alanine-D-alanine ligase